MVIYLCQILAGIILCQKVIMKWRLSHLFLEIPLITLTIKGFWPSGLYVKLHKATYQRTIILLFTGVRISNLTVWTHLFAGAKQCVCIMSYSTPGRYCSWYKEHTWVQNGCWRIIIIHDRNSNFCLDTLITRCRCCVCIDTVLCLDLKNEM